MNAAPGGAPLHRVRGALPAAWLLGVLGGLWEPRPALGREEPGWYVFQLKTGSPFTARLIGEEGDSYVLNLQGAPLRVLKSEVLSMKPPQSASPRPAAPGAQARGARDKKAGQGPPGEAAPGPAQAAGKPESPGAESALHDAVEALSSSDDAAVQRASGLLRAKLEEARPLLHSALQHPSARVRSLAAKLLGEGRNVREDLAAVSRRLSDDQAQVRLSAVMALRTMGPAALPALAQYLETERESGNRKMAVRTFQLWNDSRAVAPLAQRLAREPDPSVQRFIAMALERLTGESLGPDPAAWAAYLSEKKRIKELRGVAGVPGAGNGGGGARKPAPPPTLK